MPSGEGRKHVFPEDVLRFERAVYNKGYRIVAGLDEAGRGALCGPVVAAAVVLYPNDFIENVDDSKKLTHHQRELCFAEIKKRARDIGIGLSRSDEIDENNVLIATRKAMIRAIRRLVVPPDYLLIDAVRLEEQNIPYQSIIKGDQKSHSIAAASIVAKVIRDRIMDAWNRVYPMYGFLKHKGYGTKEHREAIRRFGPSPIHRMTFKGVYDAPVLFDEC